VRWDVQYVGGVRMCVVVCGGVVSGMLCVLVWCVVHCVVLCGVMCGVTLLCCGVWRVVCGVRCAVCGVVGVSGCVLVCCVWRLVLVCNGWSRAGVRRCIWCVAAGSMLCSVSRVLCFVVWLRAVARRHGGYRHGTTPTGTAAQLHATKQRNTTPAKQNIT
jgi:hypothetical protein